MIRFPSPVCYAAGHFPDKSASVIFKAEHSAATNAMRYELSIQMMDAYRYKREYRLALVHKPGDSSLTYWESHAYKHPGQRHIVHVSEAVAHRFVVRLLELCDKYPTLMFDDGNSWRAKSEHFVHVHDMLLAGADPSCKML